MALHWENPNYFLNQTYPFEQNIPFQFHDSPQLETDLLCFPDPLPPELIDFDVDSLFDPPPPPLQPPLQYTHHDFDFVLPDSNSFSSLDFPPPMLVDDFFAFDDDYSSQFTTPFPKRQKLISASASASVSATPSYYSNNFIAPDFVNQHYQCHYDYYANYCGANSFHEGSGNNYSSIDDGNNKVKAVTAQSKAARERRRKITEKTQELGKLIPGGHKMNTAEMLQSASKYVKFMQAQLGILQSAKALQEDEDNKDAKVNNNLSILTSPLVQEKLYAKEKCLVPLDLLPILEEHCDSESKPSISQHISDLLH